MTFLNIYRSAPYWGLALAGIVGCSPMYQSVYEGDVHFEHCYRVDEERAVAVADKLQCWRDWSQRRSFGQSRDRITYARAREATLAEALARGVTAPPRGAPTASHELPQPTNAFAPPPQVMKTASTDSHALASDGPTRTRPHPHFTGESEVPGVAKTADPSDAHANVAPASAPGATCAASCGQSWGECSGACKGQPCTSTCDEHYRGCMRTCF